MENICFNFYDVLSLFGGFLALLLGCIFVFNEKFRTKSNIAFAITLFSLSLTIFRNILGNLEAINQGSFVYYLPLFYLLLIPIGFYYSIVFLLNPEYLFKRKDYWFIAPLFVILFIDAIFLFLYLFKTEVVAANPNAILFYGDNFVNLILFIYFFLVLPSVRKKIDTYQKQLLNNFSFIEGKDLDWLRKIIVIIFVILFAFIAFRISIVFFPAYERSLFYLFLLILSALICLIAFKFIINQNFYLVPHFRDKNEGKLLQKPLSEKTEEHYQHLLKLMKKEKLHQNPELNMDTLSTKVKLSKSYLSRIINQKESKNFYDFVNTFRVEEVKNNLNHPDYAHYSILGIGLAAGFKSKSTFNTVFKKMTGKTPSIYKKTTQ